MSEKEWKWAIYWDYFGVCQEEKFTCIGDAITRIYSITEEGVDRITLFLNDDHVGTYYLPKKGYWA